MGLPVEINPLFVSSTAGYTVGRSLRFRSSASAYLNRTPASASNRTTWTWSAWVKRGALSSGTGMALMYAGTAASTTNRTGMIFGNAAFSGGGNSLLIGQDNSGTWTTWRETTAVFRDPSAWYHVIFAVDTTQATASNRIRLYVNGVEQTAFSTNNNPAQNTATFVDNNGAHYIGNDVGGFVGYFDGYLAEINFIDGQQLTPSSFGAYDTNGVWQPVKYTGTYGTNGFYLPFSNTTSTTTLVQDSSGNGNNWTPNNISLTAGTTYDSMIDSPTNSASSSNYCVMNPLLSGQVNTNAEGNLYVYSPTGSTSGSNVIGTMSVSSGKWYFEATFWQSGTTSFGPQVGITNNLDSTSQGGQTGSYAYIITGQKQSNGTGTAYAASYTTGDVIGVAFDLDAGTLTFYKNNVSQGTAFTGLSGTFFPYARNVREAAYSSGYYYNFGQRPFTYTPPSGYNALNTYNLPAPSIANGAQYMAATLYTGNGSTQTINNSSGFYPDFNWIKNRSNVGSHVLVNSVVGGTKQLFSNLTDAEQTNTNITNGISSSGIALGNNTAGTGSTNQNTNTYVAWQWLAGAGTTSSNTSGSITSTVSANTTAGFSILTFNSGAAGNKTVGHGLGVTPAMIITKDRTSANSWTTWHQSLPSATQSYLWLNSTNASANDSRQWANTAPTSSVFSFESGYTFTANDNCVAYCFAAVKGYSAFGSYTGNGSADGPFIYTGFRPRWVLIRASNLGSPENWYIHDTSRSTYNVSDLGLFPNLSNAEGGTGVSLDILSNGFKPRSTASPLNSSGTTYIYAAFAENPFNYSRAR